MYFLDAETEDYKNPPINSAWYCTYFVLTVIYIIFTIVYLYYSRNDFCSPSTFKWGKASCGLFIGALLFKAIGYCVSGSLIIKENQLIASYPKCENDTKKEITDFSMIFLELLLKYEANGKKENSDHLYKLYSKIFMVFSSFPGYCMAAAYCMIFYNWCSISIEVMERNSSSFYGKSRCVFTSLLIGIGVCFVLSTLLFCFLGGDQFHIAEAVFAIIRDFSLAIAFIIYLAKMWQIFENPCGSIKTFFCCNCLKNSNRRKQQSLNSFINYDPEFDDDTHSDSNARSSKFSSKTNVNNSTYETALVLMCSSIIFGLIVRAISIIVYTIITNNSNSKGTVCDAVNNPEYTTGYLGVFIFEAILSELLPVFAIIAYRILQPSRTQDVDGVITF